MNQITVYKNALSLTSGYLSRSLLYCSWQVTYRCNFRCSFCHYWKMKTDPKQELTVSEFASGARKLKRIGAMIVSLAGGEPMIRKDLPELVRVVSAYHFPFITTNGWLVTQKKAKQLFESGLMGAAVSIDFTEEKKHDENRGKEGAFKRAVQAVKYFVEAKFNRFQRVDITAVLMKENLDQVEKLIILAKDLGAEFTLQPYSDLKTTQSENNFSVDQEVSKHLLKLKRKYTNFKSSMEYLRRFDQFFNGGVDHCKAGKLFFNIDQKGDIAKCVEDLKNPIGNIKTIETEEMKTRLLREQAENNCRCCWYGCRGEVECFYTKNGLKSSLGRILAHRGAD
ncbi:MAG: radical SAM protein [Candidatus Zixiibacteriota bacterium]